MNERIAIVIALACSLALPACAQTVAPPAAPTVVTGSTSTEKGGGRHQEITIRATVEKVDLKSRKVTLKGFDGTRETLKVGDDVRNLAQVKKGDEVIVSYLQSVAFEVLKPGEAKPGASSAAGLARAKEGEKPGGMAAHVVTILAEIVRLDREHQTAVLRGPKGGLTTVDVQNPENFDKVKVGDTVEITLTEAMAISVEPAPHH